MNISLDGINNGSDTRREKVSEFEGSANELTHSKTQIRKAQQRLSELPDGIKQTRTNVKRRKAEKYVAKMVAEHF